MISIKTPEQIEIMAQGGKISVSALKKVLRELKPGVSLLALDKFAEKEITRQGAEPSFKTVEGYDYTTCINVNEGLVHGLPSKQKVEAGDIVSIDLGAYYKGFHTDLSYSVEVDTDRETGFLETGKIALQEGIKNCFPGKKIGDISNAIQKVIEGKGYTVSRDLVGHGLGEDLHEDPLVPGYGKENTGIRLKEGMVLAVEVIYQKGRPEIALSEDDWTIQTADYSLAGLFEHTVAITKNGPRVLTRDEDGLF